jgi:hypothetical protein
MRVPSITIGAGVEGGVTIVDFVVCRAASRTTLLGGAVLDAASSEAVDPAAMSVTVSRRLMRSIFTMEAPWMSESGGDGGIEAVIPGGCHRDSRPDA